MSLEGLDRLRLNLLNFPKPSKPKIRKDKSMKLGHTTFAPELFTFTFLLLRP